MRRIPVYRTKGAIQHSGSQIDNTGGSSVPETLEFMAVHSAARTITGAEDTTTNTRSTGETCNIGDTIKYVNLFIEAAGRVDVEVAKDRIGWLEYAVVLKRFADANVPITELGTETLGTVCTRMFEGECIWTGCFPIGELQPNCVSLKIKIPKSKQILKTGYEWSLIMYFRPASSTSTSTTAVRVWSSYMYKGYN